MHLKRNLKITHLCIPGQDELLRKADLLWWTVYIQTVDCPKG